MRRLVRLQGTRVQARDRAWSRELSKLEACHRLCANGVAAGPSNAAEDLYEDPHVRDRDMLIEVPRPDSERPLLVVGNPVKLSRVTEGSISRFPRLGEHTDAPLHELLEIEDEELAELHERGLI